MLQFQHEDGSKRFMHAALKIQSMEYDDISDERSLP